jgi:hypothetical protein
MKSKNSLTVEEEMFLAPSTNFFCWARVNILQQKNPVLLYTECVYFEFAVMILKQCIKIKCEKVGIKGPSHQIRCSEALMGIGALSPMSVYWISQLPIIGLKTAGLMSDNRINFLSIPDIQLLNPRMSMLMSMSVYVSVSVSGIW